MSLPRVDPRGPFVALASAIAGRLPRPLRFGTLIPLTLATIVGSGLSASAATASVAVQPDGKIVASGSPTTAHGRGVHGVVRYLPDGTLDRSFGRGGLADLSAGDSSLAPDFFSVDLALLPDGRMAVVGVQSSRCGFETCDSLAVVVRLNADGRRDVAFGGGDGATIAANLGSGRFIDQLDGIDAEPDGRLLVTGGKTACDYFNPDTCHAPAFILRLNRNGTRDFYASVLPPSTPGVFTFSSATVQTDGEILAAGSSSAESSLLARLNPNGSLDETFGGGDGTVIPDVPAEAVALTADGGIMVGGAQDAIRETAFWVERYTDAGDRDPDFGGGDGFARVSLAPGPTPGGASGPMRLLGEGGSVVASPVPVVCGGDNSGCEYGFGLVRFTPDGQLDPAFGEGDGALITALPAPGTSVVPEAIDLAIGDRIVIEGSAILGASPTDPGQATSVIAAFAPDGASDASFGGDGFVFNPPPSSCFGRFGPRTDAFGTGLRITGTAEADRIVGTATADVIVGLGGNDVVFGHGGDDLICGDRGDDFLRGGNGADRVLGEAGADRIVGGDGGDSLFGGRGQDRLFGGPGQDRLFGGGGNDVLDGGRGRDSVKGGAGRDEVSP